jgi:hypothetical protein
MVIFNSRFLELNISILVMYLYFVLMKQNICSIIIIYFYQGTNKKTQNIRYELLISTVSFGSDLYTKVTLFFKR